MVVRRSLKRKFCSAFRRTLFAASVCLLPTIQSAQAESKREKPRQLVTSFLLVNADTNKPVRELVDGDEINLAALPTRHLNIEAIAAPAVTKVYFHFNDRTKFVRLETIRPFAFAGDVGGKFSAWTPQTGEQLIIATPYRGSRAGESSTLSFLVVDEPKAGARREERRGLLAPQFEMIDSSKDGAKECRGFVNRDSGELNVVCSHDYKDAVGAKVLFRDGSGAAPVCEFLNSASPMITACASSLPVLDALHRGELVVVVERKNGAKSGLPIKID